MSVDRARLLVGGPLGRALLAGVVGFDDSAVDRGLDLPAVMEHVAPRIDRLATCDQPLALLAALRRNPLGFGFNVDHAEWQARLADAADVLMPVAKALVSCPAARWWWEPLTDGPGQRWLSCQHKTATLPRGEAIEAALTRAVDDEIAAQVDRDRLALSRASLRHDTSSGTWWSTPSGSGVVFTSRSGPAELPAVEVATMEDPLGPETFEVWALEPDPDARIYEVTSPDAWARLVDMAPLDVTVTHDPDWSRWTGARGQWFLPDWTVVKEHFDAVDLTVGGYLATRGMRIAAGAGSTFLAGWDAGTALWLRDAFRDVHHVGSWTGRPGESDLPAPFRL